MADEDVQSSEVRRAWRAVASVNDPEIPPLSVVDLGMIVDVEVAEDRVTVRMTPTFAACPALDVIRKDIAEAVGAAGFAEVQVVTVYDPPWTTDRITAEGRKKLKEFGLAPPSGNVDRNLVQISLENVPCPHCNSTNTALESAFGPTLCRSIHYCNACLQSFEHIKPLP
ncbi:MAG: phenylacetate-CoA oxygenase subunit PaaJ [Planctomycetes bacterium]|nr:phenylacetate-CoA oxygenase subunit PaaJ [Planctomycetota bacterium]